MNAKLPEIKKTVADLRKQIIDMVEARFPKQEEDSNYIGMRKVYRHADFAAPPPRFGFVFV